MGGTIPNIQPHGKKKNGSFFVNLPFHPKENGAHGFDSKYYFFFFFLKKKTSARII
jgi:hypothetical protein